MMQMAIPLFILSKRYSQIYYDKVCLMSPEVIIYFPGCRVYRKYQVCNMNTVLKQGGNENNNKIK